MSWESVGHSSWRRRLNRSSVTPTTVAAAAFSPKFPAIPLSVQGGGKTVIVCCTVAESAREVELLFQDGDRIEVEPVDGFLLYAVPSGHYPQGKRLEAIVSRDASGREVERMTVKTDNPGVYPCKKSEELEFGYGQTICP